MTDYQEPQVSFLVLDFNKELETRSCLASIRRHAKLPHKVVLLDNGGSFSAIAANQSVPHPDYPWRIYQEGLCDTLISKRVGRGGGFGQTDLFRWCDTRFAIFVQNDQELFYDITIGSFVRLCEPLLTGYSCVDLNGDQSHRGVWTDRAHLIETSVFNSFAPFPNGGPGNDAAPWNEAYLQRIFAERDLKIAHCKPALFSDCGKWSVREAGDGLYKHRCDTKQLYVLRKPTYRTDVYPPLDDKEEWPSMLAGKWIDGTIPKAWQQHSFVCWNN